MRKFQEALAKIGEDGIALRLQMKAKWRDMK